MNTIKFENGSDIEKSLIAVIDLALKAGGFQILNDVNIIKNSIQVVVDEDKILFQEISTPQVVAPQVEPQAEPVIEP